MSWTKRNGYWAQPLDPGEKSCYCMAWHGKDVGKEHWLIMVAAKVDSSGGDIMPPLRHAWKALRLLRPDIALDIQGYEKQYFPIKSPDDLEKWCNDTFQVSPAYSADDLFSHGMDLPGTNVMCHWIPKSKEIALVSSHWRWDLRGATFTLHKLLSEIESPSLLATDYQEEECERLPRSIPHILHELTSSSTNQEDDIAKQANHWFVNPHIDGPGVGLTPTNFMGSPGNSQMAEVILSEAVTKEVCAMSRQLGITVTTAIHASIIEAVALVNPNSSRAHQTSSCVVDLRRYLSDTLKDYHSGPLLCAVGIPFSVDAQAKWMDLIGIIQPIYRSSWNPKETNMAVAYHMMLEQLGENIFHVFGPSEEPITALSSIGIIDDTYLKHDYGSLSVTNVSYRVSNCLPTISNYCYTWDGQLRIRSCYNETFYSKEYVERWLFSLRQNLLENLGVKRSLCMDCF